MLKLKLKRREAVFIEIEGKTLGLFVEGYGEGGYKLCFSASKEFKITRENAKDKAPKSKEDSDVRNLSAE